MSRTQLALEARIELRRLSSGGGLRIAIVRVAALAPEVNVLACDEAMNSTDIAAAMSTLFSELVDGPRVSGGAFALNSGDVGLLRSLDKLSAAAASRSVNDGATIAAHAQHLRYGLSLMNRWAKDGGNPYADAKWDEAWLLSTVGDAEWDEIRAGLREEAGRWLAALGNPREANTAELSGMIATIAHLAYHLGAIRQIDKSVRGPREGVF